MIIGDFSYEQRQATFKSHLQKKIYDRRESYKQNKFCLQESRTTFSHEYLGFCITKQSLKLIFTLVFEHVLSSPKSKQKICSSVLFTCRDFSQFVFNKIVSILLSDLGLISFSSFREDYLQDLKANKVSDPINDKP